MTSSFADTHWSLIERAHGNGEDARAALSDLCGMYYLPVHRFILAWCRDPERAKDLAQDFFARVLADGSLGSPEAGKGRFRSYLLGAVKHFLCNANERAAATKRGGDILHDALVTTIADPSMLPPDVQFDRQWALSVLNATLEKVRSAMLSEGKEGVFEVLKPWLSGQADHGDTAEAAASLGVPETAVRVWLHRLRLRFRETLRAHLSQTLSPGMDVDAEIQHLLQALRGD